MARITVEDCLEEEGNRFSLVRLASLRAKQLLSGKRAVTDTRDNKAIVSALREIADGKVRFRQGQGSEHLPASFQSNEVVSAGAAQSGAAESGTSLSATGDEQQSLTQNA